MSGPYSSTNGSGHVLMHCDTCERAIQCSRQGFCAKTAPPDEFTLLNGYKPGSIDPRVERTLPTSDRDVRGDSNGWIQLFSGARLNPLKPELSQINIDDMVRGMSRENRFSGQTLFAYSVAQHAVNLVAVVLGYVNLVKINAIGERPEPVFLHEISPECAELANGTAQERHFAAYRALFHDAAEGLGMRDLARPVKHDPEMHAYRWFENQLQLAVYDRFGIIGPDPRWLKQLDALLSCTEQVQLQPHTCPLSKRTGYHVAFRIQQMSDDVAAREWRRMYARLLAALAPFYEVPRISVPTHTDWRDGFKNG